MITIDDGSKVKRLIDFGFRELKNHDNPAQSPFSRNVVTIAGRDGAWEFAVQIEEKSFEIPVKHLIKSESDFQVKLNEFNDFFYDNFGHPKRLKLIYDYEKDKFIYATLSQNFSPNRESILREFNLPFVSSDTRKHARFLPEEITWGSKTIDFTFPYRFGLGKNGEGGINEIRVKSNTIFNVVAEGIAVKPIIIIEGSATNLVITCNGEKISIGTFKNTKWEIDCENFISYKNGQEQFIDMNDFWLLPEANKVNVSGAEMDFKLSVNFRNRYM